MHAVLINMWIGHICCITAVDKGVRERFIERSINSSIIESNASNTLLAKIAIISINSSSMK